MRLVEASFVALVCIASLPGAVQAQAECEGGRVASVETAGRCCWPGQWWSDPLGRCTGVPTCPSGTGGQGETCVALDAPAPEASAPILAPERPLASTATTPSQPSLVASVASASVPAEGGTTALAEAPGEWPSSTARPSGVFNPRMGRGPRRGLVRSGATLFGIGYATSIAASVVGFSRSEWNGAGYDDGCYEPAGSYALIPLVGALVAALSVGGCSYYNVVGEEYRSADATTHVILGIASSVFQFTGFVLLVSGLIHSKPLVEYSVALDDDRDVRLAFHPMTLAGGTGLGVTLTH
jgi:hypothetical protein